MTKDTSYRLGRYEIIEKENGEVWWETHAGFGRLRAGKCFIEGEILFIGPYKTEELGFLKGEFIQHLNKLPKWVKPSITAQAIPFIIVKLEEYLLS